MTKGVLVSTVLSVLILLILKLFAVTDVVSDIIRDEVVGVRRRWGLHVM